MWSMRRSLDANRPARARSRSAAGGLSAIAMALVPRYYKFESISLQRRVRRTSALRRRLVPISYSIELRLEWPIVKNGGSTRCLYLDVRSYVGEPCASLPAVPPGRARTHRGNSRFSIQEGENLARDGLSAGGRWIRTIGPSRIGRRYSTLCHSTASSMGVLSVLTIRFGRRLLWRRSREQDGRPGPL